jgi:glycosyltransferase involved in cell wall biosynthesis
MTHDGLDRPLRVVQVTKHAHGGGGAYRIATSLHEGLLERGHRSWIAATESERDDPTVVLIPVLPRRRNFASRGLRRAARALGRRRGRGRAVRSVQHLLRVAAAPKRSFDRYRGREDFDYPGTALIPDLPPETPDLIHCHNLHGRFFDLRELAPMSHRLPLVMTLHDEWTYTGHCAYGMGCERWRTGCGSCPDLTIYPAIPRDATHANRREKQRIYGRSLLYISTPSQWLMDNVRDSILMDGAAGLKVINNGVDRRIFAPGDQRAARQRLGLPMEPIVLLFTANLARRNVFKDWETVLTAATRAAALVTSRPVLCLALGDEGEPHRFENGELRFVPYQFEMAEVATFYRAADVYLHAARAENFPTTIMEALATGLPVVATAVGGIPEQVRSLAGVDGAWSGAAVPLAEATGVLVAPGDGVAMGRAAAALLNDDTTRRTLAANATRDAALRFDLGLQLDVTVDWYREVIADWRDRVRVARP